MNKKNKGSNAADATEGVEVEAKTPRKSSEELAKANLERAITQIESCGARLFKTNRMDLILDAQSLIDAARVLAEKL